MPPQVTKDRRIGRGFASAIGGALGVREYFPEEKHSAARISTDTKLPL